MNIVHAQLAKIRRRFLKTNIPKEYAVLGAVLSLSLFIEDGVLCNIIGFLYTTIKSFQALENRVSSEVTHWLVYWMIFSFFSMVKVFIDVLLYWIPIYYPFNCLDIKDDEGGSNSNGNSSNNYFLAIDRMLPHTVPHFLQDSENRRYLSRDVMSESLFVELQEIVMRCVIRTRIGVDNMQQTFSI